MDPWGRDSSACEPGLECRARHASGDRSVEILSGRKQDTINGGSWFRMIGYPLSVSATGSIAPQQRTPGACLHSMICAA